MLIDHQERCSPGDCFAHLRRCPIAYPAGSLEKNDKIKLKSTPLGRYIITGVGRDHVLAVHVNPEYDEEVVFRKDDIEKVD